MVPSWLRKEEIYSTHCLNMAAFHMEALRKQRVLDRKFAKQEPLEEKKRDPFKIARSGGKTSWHRFCQTKRGSASIESSSDSGSKRSSESSGMSETTTSSSPRSSKSSQRSVTLKRMPETSNIRDLKSRLYKRTTPPRMYQNIPPGMSPAWYHHLNKQAKILRDHGLVMGHLSQFVD
ncbi:uncharacterized protein LOC134349192 isoform X2 [Mobula hypostoma]|uniref:uncharacterized protein LOC134349192 isoform X2 n=1 Tax=Mobula hypostoma TaxID=723540 RepID=UPI002FC39170